MISNEPIKVTQSQYFRNVANNLNSRQKKELHHAIRHIADTPDIGVKQKGDLSYLRIYKFWMIKEIALLGYTYENNRLTLHILMSKQGI